VTIEHASRSFPPSGDTCAVAGMPASRLSIAALWLTVSAIPDPEVPVVSIAELGILRGIEWDAVDPSTLVVTVTPTYSGCPATELIATLIHEALAEAGVTSVRIDTKLAPPWSTDWISPEGARKLRDFGIAPPQSGRTAATTSAIDVAGISPLRGSGAAVQCPRCGSATTELLSQFGSTACKAQYRCLDCLEPFDYFKPL